jgi:hypothetical protein
MLDWSQAACFRLDHGTVVITAQHRSATDALTIATPRALATVVGTRFTLSHRADQTALQVTEGIVRFACTGAAERLVHAGEGAVSPRALPPASAPAAPPAPSQPHVDPNDTPHLIGFRFVDAVSGATLPGWELVTTDANMDADKMPAHGWTVIAITKPDKIPAVQFSIDGVAVGALQILPPYALTNTKDHKNGERFFEPWNPAPGTHRLKAVASRSEREMQATGSPLEITLTIVASP